MSLVCGSLRTGTRKHQSCIYRHSKNLENASGEKLLFLSNQKNIFELVREFSKSQDISLETVSMPVQNLPAVPVSDNYVKACQRMQLAISPKSSWNNYRTIQEKGIKHYFQRL